MEIAALVLGLCIGSFLAAFTFRSPKGESILKGRSYCSKCKARIRWYDNIPLLSFVLLKGKCRDCREKISMRYPLIEAGTALVFFGYFLSLKGCSNVPPLETLCSWRAEFGTAVYLFAAVITSVLIAVFVIDFEKKIIPDELIFLGILFVLSLYFFSDSNLISRNFLVGFVAALFFLLIHLGTRGRGMGLGDVKFVLLGGFILGWPKTIFWLFLAFVAGALMGVILILLKKAKFGREIAFGPYLVGSLLLTIIFGEEIIQRYLLNF